MAKGTLHNNAFCHLWHQGRNYFHFSAKNKQENLLCIEEIHKFVPKYFRDIS